MRRAGLAASAELLVYISYGQSLSGNLVALRLPHYVGPYISFKE